jgi:hypothetical protein
MQKASRRKIRELLKKGKKDPIRFFCSNDKEGDDDDEKLQLEGVLLSSFNKIFPPNLSKTLKNFCCICF